MEPIETIRQALQELHQIVAFLEDHPKVEIYHANYRKLRPARMHLRTIRQGLRDFRERGQPRRHQEEILIRCDDLISECLPELDSWPKRRFSELINNLDRAIRSAHLA